MKAASTAELMQRAATISLWKQCGP